MQESKNSKPKIVKLKIENVVSLMVSLSNRTTDVSSYEPHYFKMHEEMTPL